MLTTDFTIEQEDVNGIRVLHIHGYLDAHTFQELDDAISYIFDEGIYKIAVNLEDVNYISSAGAGVFIGAYGNARDHGGDIVLVNPTEGVLRIFELLGITQLFTIADTIERAVNSFS